MRSALVASNLGALITLLPALVLASHGQLELWHIYVVVPVASAWQSLLWPAVSASIPLLVRKKDFLRANGMTQASNAASGIVAPLLGGLVALYYDLGGILIITILAYASSLPSLALVRIPRPANQKENAKSHSYMRDVYEAWAFLRGSNVLLRLNLIFAVCSFIVAIATMMVRPLVLSFAPPSALGTVMSAGALGMLAGGITVASLGKRATSYKQVMLLMLMAGSCMAMAGIRPMVPLIAATTFTYLFAMAIVSSGVQTIIQNSVPVTLQGRIHATLAGLSWASMAVAYPIAGPLADYVFEPLLMEGGWLAGSVGLVIGTGAGRGMGLLLIILGSFIMGLSLIGQIEPRKRHRGVDALAASEQE